MREASASVFAEHDTEAPYVFPFGVSGVLLDDLGMVGFVQIRITHDSKQCFLPPIVPALCVEVHQALDDVGAEEKLE